MVVYRMLSRKVIIIIHLAEGLLATAQSDICTVQDSKRTRSAWASLSF